LIEAGVLLVSIKIILLSYKNSISSQEILKKLDEIDEKIKETEN